MALILKFAYTLILFVSLFMVVVVGQVPYETKCETDEDCYKMFPLANRGAVECKDGVCGVPLIE
ncbi:CCP protein [Trifolium pratense]|uniref:Uncharacterized protein n=2 Tax=Trifolium pratense TaxID=57577 RepID=A0ACB0LPT6_TRIPR|nr:CCP protein [Trifolium pratense]CAJ2670553.1 unnamed protein product [Trifolium pratense]